MGFFPQYTTNGSGMGAGASFLGQGQAGGAQPPPAAPANPFGGQPKEGTMGDGGGMSFIQPPKGQDGNPFAPAPAPQAPGSPFGGNPGVTPPPQSLGGMFGGLHPQVQNMLRSIPPQAMEQLTRSGLIHPGLMQHLRGGANGTDNGRQEDRGQEGGGSQPPQFGGGRVSNGWSAM